MKEIVLFEQGMEQTPVMPLSGDYGPNRIYIKRDDMIPFSFGGNKARKAAEFYHQIKARNADIVMTYGSNASNHCRIIANMAKAMGIDCHIISPEGHEEILYNTLLVKCFGASVEKCPVSEVSRTIEDRMDTFRREGRNPYFIMGGGHGNVGTEGYVKAFAEIARYEKENQTHFDYVFHASGTGTTQAGLVCGQLLSGDFSKKIIGISIARPEETGRQVVKNSIRDYLGDRFDTLFSEETLIFEDSYRCGGYGEYTDGVVNTIRNLMEKEGIPMDTTYVGKAFHGMCEYIKEQNIQDKKILFIHTGGTPLFFDLLKK